MIGAAQIMEHSFPRTFAPGSEKIGGLSLLGTFDLMRQSNVELSLPNTNYQ